MVKNLALCQQVLDSIQTMSEAGEYMRHLCQNGGDLSEYVSLMKSMLLSLRAPINNLLSEEPAIMSHLMCENVEYSLESVTSLYKKNRHEADKKIEFELLPIIREMYADLYFFGIKYPDTKKMRSYYEKDVFDICGLPPYIVQAEQTGTYKYDLSIAIVGYNHVDITKNCVSSLMRSLPRDMSYELIFYNNGSSDETEQYFNSLECTKQINVKRGVKSLSLLGRVVEGKYIAFISNDVLVTPYAIENLVKCMDSDENIAVACPACPNVSNLQTIPAAYQNIEELYTFAKSNNVSDPYRWEQRSRLALPMALLRSKVVYVYGLFEYGFMHAEERFLSFADDKMSMLVRRNGYKLMLCKDAYVHHMGSATVKHEEAVKQSEFYAIGRQKFYRAFGIDPWGTGFCFAEHLMNALNPRETCQVNILGINCGMGDNPLHIKQLLRANVHNTDVTVYNATTNKAFEPDLTGISDYFQIIQSDSELDELFRGVVFRYIVIEECLKQLPNPFGFLQAAYERLEDDGKLSVCIVNSITGTDNSEFEEIIKKRFETKELVGEGISWLLLHKPAD